MIYTEFRKTFFDLLCRDSSPDFIEYLRAYEDLPMPPKELFEISCELVNGIRVDNMRLAIMSLHMRDVLRWLSVCRCPIPWVPDFFSKNVSDNCFGIGLADYPYGSGVCRVKLYNTYTGLPSQARKVAHIKKLFSLLKIPDGEFKKDLSRFRAVRLLSIDWDQDKQAAIKVYFGPFHPEQLSGRLSEALSKDDTACYDILGKNGLLPVKVEFTIRYSKDLRSQKMEMFCPTSRSSEVVPYLKMFDHKREVSKFFVNFSRNIASLNQQVISMQWTPIQKMQFYFQVIRVPGV